MMIEQNRLKVVAWRISDGYKTVFVDHKDVTSMLKVKSIESFNTQDVMDLYNLSDVEPLFEVSDFKHKITFGLLEINRHSGY